MGETCKSLPSILNIIKDIITIISIGIAGYVALRGLKTWQDQLMGTTEFDLSKRLLKSVYVLRDALQSVRRPFISGEEERDALKSANLEISYTDKNYRDASKAAVYQKRWEPVAEAFKTLELEAVEAEALWGSGIREKTNKIQESIISLSVALQLILRDSQYQQFDELDDENRKLNKRIIYSLTSNPEEDPYLKKLISSINEIESIVRPFMKRK